jgi:hypothetical protein
VTQENGFLYQVITCPPEFASNPYPPIIALFPPHLFFKPKSQNRNTEDSELLTFEKLFKPKKLNTLNCPVIQRHLSHFWNIPLLSPLQAISSIGIYPNASIDKPIPPAKLYTSHPIHPIIITPSFFIVPLPLPPGETMIVSPPTPIPLALVP